MRYLATLLRDTFDYDKGTVFLAYKEMENPLSVPHYRAQKEEWRLFHKQSNGDYVGVMRIHCDSPKMAFFRIEKDPEGAWDMRCPKCGGSKLIPEVATSWEGPCDDHYGKATFTVSFVCFTCDTVLPRSIRASKYKP